MYKDIIYKNLIIFLYEYGCKERDELLYFRKSTGSHVHVQMLLCKCIFSLCDILRFTSDCSKFSGILNSDSAKEGVVCDPGAEPL